MGKAKADEKEEQGQGQRQGGETDAVCASFLAFAAKQTQIKTFDVNLLAMAKTTEHPQDRRGGSRAWACLGGGREKAFVEICTTNVYEFCGA